jgi:hypothetical protein
MPVTIMAYVKSKVGEKDTYTAEDCLACGVDILGGCEGCHATIACYNAYPSKSGYWRCADCIGDTGFNTVEEFKEFERSASAAGESWPSDLAPDLAACPACGSDDMHELAEDYFECGTCGAEWTP